MYLLYFKRLTIINILIRIKTDSFKKYIYIYIYFAVYSATESDVTYSELCSAFNPSKVHTHSSEHTHTHREHTPGAVGSHLYCILMLVIMVVLGKPNIF